MPIFSQFGEIVWQRLFNIARILQTTALKVAETIEINEKQPDLISKQKNANKINRVRKYFELSKLNKLLRWSLFFSLVKIYCTFLLIELN